MAKKTDSLDTADMFRMLQQGLKAQAVRPNLHAYKPHAKQEIFHKSTKKKKLYIGGNRSGKTVGGIVEDIYWLRGNHPFRRIPEGPIRGRVVGVDFLNGISKIILPEFQRWCPPSLLKNGSWEDSYNKELRTLKLENGSFIEFMSYDQDTDKFAGTSRHFCVDQDVKILSKRGWLLYDEMTVDDEILTVNPDTLQNEWSSINYIYRGIESNSLLRVRSRNNFDVKVTPGHRWLVSNKKTGKVYFNTTENLKKSEQLIMHGSTIEQTTEVYNDAFVALVGWVVTDGSLCNTNQVMITQSWIANESKCEYIELLLKEVGADFKEYNYRSSVSVFYIGGEIAAALRKVVTKTRGLIPEFLLSLSTRQLQILLGSILDGDGCRLESGKIMIADSLRYPEHMDMYCMLISMLGRRVMYSVGEGSYSYQLMSKSNSSSRYNYSKVSVDSLDISDEKYSGVVWCPNTDNGTFYGMKNGSVFLTGNTHYDEEPPQHIYNECNARLVDTGGSFWMTMTPVEGMCVDTETELFSQRGWLKYNEVKLTDIIMTHQGWKKLEGLYIDSSYIGSMIKFQGIDALVTPNHKWLTVDNTLIRTDELTINDTIETHVPDTYNNTMPALWTDEFWELVGLIIGDGAIPSDSSTKVVFYQNFKIYPENCDRFEYLVEFCGGKWNEGSGASQYNIRYNFGGDLGREIRKLIGPKKVLSYELLSILPINSLESIIHGLVASDGTIKESGTREITTVSKVHADQYSAIAALAGYRVTVTSHPIHSTQLCYKVRLWNDKNRNSNWDVIRPKNRVEYAGTVWCPSTDAGTFLARRNGSIYITGNSWIYDTLYVPGTETTDSNVEVITVDMLENPYIDPEAAEEFLSGLTPEERKAREHGEFVQLGGRVFKNFARDIHVIPPITPKEIWDWEWYLSLDHGFNNPTAILWHAVSPEGNVITFAEHYESEMVIDDHAKAIHARNLALGREPDIMVADPAIAQRQGVTGASIQGEYADRGIFLSLGNNDVSVGIARMAQYLRENPKTGKPFWVITENCVNLVSELSRLRWRTFSSRKMQFENNKQEKIHKKDDHAADSARYFFSFLPDLTPQNFGTAKLEESVEFHAVEGRNPNKDAVDSIMNKMFVPAATQWKTTESSDMSGLEYE